MKKHRTRKKRENKIVFLTTVNEATATNALFIYEVCLVQNRTTQITGKPCIVERRLENNIGRTVYDDDFEETHILSISYLARASQLRKHATHWTPHTTWAK